MKPVKAKAPKMQNVYLVFYSIGGVKGTNGIPHTTAGSAYGEATTLERNGLNGVVVELTQVRSPIA